MRIIPALGSTLLVGALVAACTSASADPTVPQSSTPAVPSPALSTQAPAPSAPPVAPPTPSAPATPALPSADPAMSPRGPAKSVSKVDTTDNVVFLTIDDGEVADPKLVDYLTAFRIPVTTFLSTMYGQKDWTYWQQMAKLGSIQDHTMNHPDLSKRSSSSAVNEVCGAAQAIAANTGSTPWMLRPPYGNSNANVRSAAGQCGLDYTVLWTVSLPHDKLVYQVGDHLRPGDIILTHFRWDLMDYLPAVIADIQAQGFRVARLEDYLPPTTPAG